MTPIVIHIKHSFEIAPATLRPLESLMATLQEVRDALADVRALLTTEKDQAAAKDVKIADLEARLRDAGTPEERDALLAEIETIKAELPGVVKEDAGMGTGTGTDTETPTP